jgi:hypothetical protein
MKPNKTELTQQSKGEFNEMKKSILKMKKPASQVSSSSTAQLDTGADI